jgi:hypothetical protein
MGIVGSDCHLNDTKLDALSTHVGSQVFITGYPYQHYEGWMLPIWKRGSIASEPLWPFDDKPMFLVDSKTSPGMSGSPVFRRDFGAIPLQNGQIVHSKGGTEFVGVYSGRIAGPNMIDLDIGYVWAAYLINELFESSFHYKKLATKYNIKYTY